MSEKKKEKKSEQFSLAEETFVSGEIGYTHEQEVKNTSDMTILDDNINPAMRAPMAVKFTEGIEGEEDYKVKVDIKKMEFDLQYQDRYEFLQTFSIQNMKERIDNGENVSDICSDLRTFILNNKDTNPDLVQRAVAQLLEDAEGYYDYSTDNWLGKEGFTRNHQGDTSEEVLTKILNVPDGESLSGFVCSTISEFGMHLLEECDIKATMLCGGTNGTNHTTLLWQRSDGKFVQSNYGHSYTLDAANMKDAAREVYKRDLGLLNNGYIYFVDSNGSYQEFAMKEEAVWGRELDKRDYNNQSVFNHSVAKQSSIQGTANISNLGSVSAEVQGTLAYHNEDNTKSKETTFSVGYKKSGVTSLADSSTSVGAKYEHKTEQIIDEGKKFSNTKVVVDYSQLHTNALTVDYDKIQPIESRTIRDPEHLAQLREYYNNEYLQNNSIEDLNWHYNCCQRYLDNYDEEYRGASPITKEEYIANQHKVYKSGDGVAYEDLDDFGKKNADEQILYNWDNYLINNRYDGAKELVLERQAGYKDNIDNYDQYREKYVEDNIGSITTLSGYNKDEVPNEKELGAFNTNHLSMFVRKLFGQEKTLVKDGNIELTNAWQVGGLLGFNVTTTSSLAFGGDVRLFAEEGLRLNVGDKNTLSSTAVSAGVVADMSLKSGTLTPSVSPGVKLNGSSVFQTRVNDKVSFGAGVDGYAVVTRQSTDWGVGGNAQATYKPQGMNVTIFGSAEAGVDKQQLRIGGFNALSDYVTKLGLSLGVKFNTGSVQFNYTKYNDKLNSTRDRAVFSVGARINL